MEMDLQYGQEKITLSVPDDCIVYKSNYRSISHTAGDLLLNSIANPIDDFSLTKRLQKRRNGDVVIIVSDITRPIPYSEFLPELITELIRNGVEKNQITILVATGMHRPSTKAEQYSMFGDFVTNNFRIINHECENESELQCIEGRSWSGSEVKLNKHYVQAGFRIITGLVEPHFMAGFSGGRKAICPGLVSLDTLKQFHGYEFLSHPNASSGVLEDNPCHLENSSIARMCPPDYSINVVLDNHKKVNAITSGELFASHAIAVEIVKSACCPIVDTEADLAITSGGGYPLDATFYQCVKGMVNALPAIKNKGEIIALGGCAEGIGSLEYTALLKKYQGNYLQFIKDIKESSTFIKDQWQLQMQTRVLEKTGQENLHFYTSGISQSELSMLSVQPYSMDRESIAGAIQEQINKAVKERKQIAIFPEGPYCSPVNKI